MRRKIICCIIIVLLFLGSSLNVCASAEENIMVPDVLQDVFVYDQGDFLSTQIEEQINNLLVQLEEKTTIEFAVITIPSLGNLSIEQYAYRLGSQLGIGKSEEDNGILLLISKTDTRVRLEIGVGLQGLLTDSISGRILDDFFVPYRDEGKYDDASLNTVNAVINYLADSEEYEFSEIEGLNKEISIEVEEQMTDAETVISLIILIIILIAVEWITGSIFGNGFGDGLVFAVLVNSRSNGGSSRGSFGGGRFNGGGASR